MIEPPIEEWSRALAESIRGLTCVNRVMVLPEVGSTQDEAMAAGGPGLAVVAIRQTAGRGRLGRAWTDSHGQSLSLSVALAMDDYDLATLSLGAGLAACATAEEALGERVGLRWPNDVVEVSRGAAPDGPAPGRKIAGVLIERARGLAVVGIGINVAQREGDWPPGLRDRAVSLAALGAAWSRLETAARVLPLLDDALRMPRDELRVRWMRRECLTGTVQTFEHDGRRITGRVQGIDPTSEIVVASEGRLHRLPALTTSLIPPAV